eukprot:TRINITY_DN3253_c0_g1_i1.p1 TRINITY_DN3253_c0_g1~~TRINITY_DN3253_c0_g1_i1.p1  ORF type:complete len:101 (-),score=17.07 TRINITY_DN3253_c0_g1_i1:102-404(-)
MDYDVESRSNAVIFDVIGSPTEVENSKNNRMKKHVNIYVIYHNVKKNLKRMFPGADKHALDLMVLLLKFDVDKRITVDQALEHPYLKPVRDPAHERAKNL